jgi:hypothetical protein
MLNRSSIATVCKYSDTAQLRDDGKKSRKKVQKAVKLITDILPKLTPQFTRNISDRTAASDLLENSDLLLLAIQPTMDFSFLSDSLPLCSFFTLLSPPSYSHYLLIFFDIYNPFFSWSPSDSRTYRFPL